jgi:hypothetical protein
MIFFWKKKSDLENVKILLDKLVVEDWIKIKDSLEEKISSYSDGFFYECESKSGIEKFNNPYTVTRYINSVNNVNVFTNNLKSSIINNKGSIFYFPTEEDALHWRNHLHNSKIIEIEFDKIKKWEESTEFIEKKAFFPPTYTRDTLLDLQRKMEEEKENLIKPTVL